jgi:hypothetical protein
VLRHLGWQDSQADRCHLHYCRLLVLLGTQARLQRPPVLAPPLQLSLDSQLPAGCGGCRQLVGRHPWSRPSPHQV